MARLVHTHSGRVRTEKGVEYIARVHGKEVRPGGTWRGWLEFHPVGAGGPVLRTGTETTQPDFDALEYWASGLEPIYLEGAIQRAHPMPGRS